MKTHEIHTAVRKKYAEIAQTGSSCCGPSCCGKNEPARDPERAMTLSQESVNAEDLAWECVLLMMGIGVLSGSLGVHELAHHPVPRLLRKKAREIGALSQDFLRVS